MLILLIAFFRGFSALKNKTSILTIIILGFSLIGFTGIAINNAIMPEFKKREDLTFNDYKFESYLNQNLDEASLNSTLCYKLKHEYNINFPTYKPNDNLEKYFKNSKRRIVSTSIIKTRSKSSFNT